MKEYLKNITKASLKFKIDSFIEDKFIDIIEAAKVGKNKYIIEIDEIKNKDLLPFVKIIKDELKFIFDDCKVDILEDENETNKSIIIDWS